MSGFRAPPGWKKTICRRRGSGFRAPPGWKKTICRRRGSGFRAPPRFWSKIQKTGGHPEPSISILRNRILNWGRGRSWGPPHLGCFGGASGWKKTICRRRGSGFRAPPGWKKTICRRRGSGFRAPPGWKKTICRRRGSGFRTPPGGKKNHLPTKGVRV